MARRKLRYPGVEAAMKERSSWKQRKRDIDEKPDWLCGAPNYEKWPNKTAEEVLVMLNVD